MKITRTIGTYLRELLDFSGGALGAAQDGKGLRYSHSTGKAEATGYSNGEIDTALAAKVPESQRDQPSGFPGLDADGKLPALVTHRYAPIGTLRTEVPAAGQIVLASDTKVAYFGDGVRSPGIPIAGMPGENVLMVSASSTPADNGQALVSAVALAATMTPNGSALSATNPISIILSPGLYTLSSTLTVTADYVNLIGAVSSRSAVRITGSIDLNGENHRIANLTISSILAFKNIGSSTGSVVENVECTFLNADGRFGGTIRDVYCTQCLNRHSSATLLLERVNAASIMYMSVANLSFGPWLGTVVDCVLRSNGFLCYGNTGGSFTASVVNFIRLRMPAGVTTTLRAGTSSDLTFTDCDLTNLSITTSSASTSFKFYNCRIAQESIGFPGRPAELYGCRVAPVGTNLIALRTQGSGTLKAQNCYLKPTGTAFSVDAAIPANVSISNTVMTVGFGANITNVIATPNNVVDANA